MPRLKWSELSHLQLGQYAEYYSKMEFTSYGYDVYTSEVDDHGVDFIAKNPKTGAFYEVQVKALRKSNYAFIKKDKITLDDKHIVCFLKFEDDKTPEVYIFDATVWNNPNAVFVDRANYDIPEWGINYSKKNIDILEQHKEEKFFEGDD